MDEKPVDHPGVPEDAYHTLGGKTLWVFVLRRINGATAILLATIVLFVLKDQPFLKNVGAHDLRGYANTAAWVALALFCVVFLVIFLVSWLIYINYKFFLGEDALKIKHGIFMKEETAIPYRQIQNVDIQRDLSYQAFGLSRIVILTAGQDEEKTPDDESEGVLPGLDKDLAEWLQSELLRRANVQKVVETK
jgi:putative membrane protein